MVGEVQRDALRALDAVDGAAAVVGGERGRGLAERVKLRPRGRTECDPQLSVARQHLVQVVVRVDANGEAFTRQRVLDEPLEGQAALELVAPLPCEDVLPLACGSVKSADGREEQSLRRRLRNRHPLTPLLFFFVSVILTQLTLCARGERGAGRGARAGRGGRVEVAYRWTRGWSPASDRSARAPATSPSTP